jgi:predicted patatin/cPLA2 family phospholipase
MSYPGLFAPVQINGRWLVDGGVVDPVPVGCDRHGHELAGESPVITPERREYVGKGKGARRNFLDLPEEG